MLVANIDLNQNWDRKYNKVVVYKDFGVNTELKQDNQESQTKTVNPNKNPESTAKFRFLHDQTLEVREIVDILMEKNKLMESKCKKGLQQLAILNKVYKNNLKKIYSEKVDISVETSERWMGNSEGMVHDKSQLLEVANQLKEIRRQI